VIDDANINKSAALQ